MRPGVQLRWGLFGLLRYMLPTGASGDVLVSFFGYYNIASDVVICCMLYT